MNHTGLAAPLGGSGPFPSSGSTTMLNRAPSRASGRTAGSTLSKSQSLIKKNIELQDLKPADVLIERFVAWKAIVKQLTMYFEVRLFYLSFFPYLVSNVNLRRGVQGLADIENNTAKEMIKLAGLVQVPFKSGNQFLGEGGLQDVYYSIRDKTRAMADQHANLGRTIDSSIVEHLKKLLAEIKAHIRNVQNDTGKLAASVAKERELSTRLVGELANSVSMYKNTPMQIPAKSDPAQFESGIMLSLQSAWSTFDDWNLRSYNNIYKELRELAEEMAGQRVDREWIAFASRTEHLVDPETPLRDPGVIVYPLMGEASTRAVHSGHLERKVSSGFPSLFHSSKSTSTSTSGKTSGGYKESWYVLTPAGFLHEFSTSDPGDVRSAQPTFSIFLPNCTLGPASAPGASMHRFHIEGRRDGSGNPSRGGLKSLLKGHNDVAGGAGTGGQTGESGKAWTFRARSHEDMMEWWNDIRMLCARYLVASQPVVRSGPVEAAVRAVGYAPEDVYSHGEEEEDEVRVHDDEVGLGGEYRGEYEERVGGRGYEEREGSSVEEEGGEVYVREAPPGYSHHHQHQAKWVEVGGNGWAVDKKLPPGFPHPEPTTHTNSSPYYSDLPAPVGSGTAYRPPYESVSGYAPYGPGGVGIGNDSVVGVGVGGQAQRRGSTRSVGVNGNGATNGKERAPPPAREELDRDEEREEDEDEDTLEEEGERRGGEGQGLTRQVVREGGEGHGHGDVD
ncbi:hypothetical protein MD484_g6083, partial [Candolleomyces efflorescens]